MFGTFFFTNLPMCQLYQLLVGPGKKFTQRLGVFYLQKKNSIKRAKKTTAKLIKAKKWADQVEQNEHPKKNVQLIGQVNGKQQHFDTIKNFVYISRFNIERLNNISK